MSENIFIPQNNEQMEPSVRVATSQPSTMLMVARLTLLVFVFVLPLVFAPGLWASLGFSKTLLAVVAVAVVLVAGVAHVLHAPQVTLRVPWLMCVGWLFAVVVILAALLTPDVQDALRGSYLEVQTAGFFVMLVSVVSAMLVLVGAPIVVQRVLLFLGVSLSLVMLYSVLRIIFGAGFLSFGTFTVNTSSLAGGFNDLALLAGMVVISSLTVLGAVSVSRLQQALLACITILALFLLVAVNFVMVWWVLGVFAAGFGVHQLLSQKHSANESARTQRFLTLVISVLVVVVCGWHALSNSSEGTVVQRFADISFIEVRPSFTATLDIVRNVYNEQAFLGAGPNQFSAAWREYKDPSINETIFWNTDFVSGFSFMLTTFVQFGVLGGVLLVVFQLWFMWSGYRALTTPQVQNSRWHVLAAVPFAAAVFLWVMTYFYTPGTTTLLLTAVLTGVALVGITMLRPQTAMTFSISRATGGPNIGKILVALVVLGGASTILYSVYQQYDAQATVNQAIATNTFDRSVATAAYEKYTDPRFLQLRAQVSSAELLRLTSLSEPSEDDQVTFVTAAETAVQDARSAVAADTTGVSSHFIQAGVFNMLANTGVEGARDLAIETLETAQNRNKQNPELALVRAQVYAQANDIEAARSALEEAITLKRNYTPALVSLTELDIAAGDLPAAIERTQAIVTLEPRNPTRYFQLGMLYMANNRLEPAQAAYEAALTLDPSHANARYMLAQLYIAQGKIEEAIIALERVQATNQDNELLEELLTNLRSGSSTTPTGVSEAQLQEPTATIEANNSVITNTEPDTALVTPVNRATDETEETQ